jgi:hypothetical protein
MARTMRAFFRPDHPGDKKFSHKYSFTLALFILLGIITPNPLHPQRFLGVIDGLFTSAACRSDTRKPRLPG